MISRAQKKSKDPQRLAIPYNYLPAEHSIYHVGCYIVLKAEGTNSQQQVREEGEKMSNLIVNMKSKLLSFEISLEEH